MSDTGKNRARRSEFYTFLNIGGSTENWVREGRLAAEMTVRMNPRLAATRDITRSTAVTEVTGYQPEMSVGKSVSKSDPAFAFIDKIRRERSVLSGAYAELLHVDVFNGSDGSYPAVKQPVSVRIDSFGGPASDPLTISYTYDYRGEAVRGTATITNGNVSFTASGG